MFDISFTELMLIGLIALIVIGPERLPRVARTVGHLLGRAQRYVGDVKSDIQREMEVDQLKDLKGQMEEAAKSVKTSVKDATDTLRDPLEDARKALRETTESVESLAKATQDELNELSDVATKTDPADTSVPTDSAGTAEKAESISKAEPTQTMTPVAEPPAAPEKTSTADDVATAKNAPDTPQPVRALSDAELADQRLAQAAPSSDVQHTNTLEHDNKPGTPL